MSGSGRKDFDVKHILRLRWKLFSHPSPSPGGPAGGGCLQQDGGGSFEHWGPSQSRLLKGQDKGSGGTFWKKPSSSSSSSSSSSPSSSSFNPLNGTLLPVPTRLQQGAPGQGTQQPTRTLFYVESLEEEEVPGMDFPGPHEKGLVLQELKVEPATSSQATGEGGGHRYSKAPWGTQAFPSLHPFPPTPSCSGSHEVWNVSRWKFWLRMPAEFLLPKFYSYLVCSLISIGSYVSLFFLQVFRVIITN